METYAQLKEFYYPHTAKSIQRKQQQPRTESKDLNPLTRVIKAQAQGVLC
jgi:hypothetical protein